MGGTLALPENAGREALQKELASEPPWFVGILNVTPDSFSDGGRYVKAKDAIEAGYVLAAAGAHIIEIGGESTRPGSIPISAEEEISRIEPVVRELSSRLFVSIDTYKGDTARMALSHGARMVNDVSALRADPTMPQAIKNSGAFLALMYSKQPAGLPHVSETNREYTDIIKEICGVLVERLCYVRKHGISLDRLVVDPGMGSFLSHDSRYSWELLSRLEEFKQFGINLPMMIGTSRKGFLGGAVHERDRLSQLTALLAYEKGVDLIRTHNVTMAKELFTAWEKLY